MDWSLNIDPGYVGALLDSLSEGVYITSPQGITLGVNRAYEKITGIAASSLIGRHMDDIVSEGLLSGTITSQVIETGEEVVLDQRIFNGKRCLIKGRPITDGSGQIVLVMTVVRDMDLIDSLQREMEKALQLASHYKNRLDEQSVEEGFVMKSYAFRKVVTMARKVAAIDSTVLIVGESGTGKEIIAEEIYKNSLRVGQPFIKINCGSIPENLLESELFGYEKGAFTGALPGGHMGLFQVADKGTLFLDELAELPLALQVKLLRVLQEKVITRIGSSKPVPLDVRIIAATNADLEQLIQEKKFRKDLYYRLRVVQLDIPALRDRADDIPALMNFFTDKLNARYGMHKRLHPDLYEDFLTYHWPGNVRELENTVESMIVTAEEDIVTRRDLPRFYRAGLSGEQTHITISGIIPLQNAYDLVEEYLIRETRRQYKSTYKMASVLKISQPSAARKVRKYLSPAEEPPVE